MGTLVETWSDPHTRHAMIIHVPIALGVLGVLAVLPLLCLAAGGFRSAALKGVVIGCFVLASAGAKAAALSGAEAADRLRDGSSLSPADAEAVNIHQRRGELAWIWPLIPAVLTGATFARRRDLAAAGGTLAVIGAGGVAVWFGVIAHAGGQLVYARGLGVPGRAPNAATAPHLAEAETAAAPGAD